MQGNACLGGQHAHYVLVSDSESAVLLVDGLQDSDNGAVRRLDGHAKDCGGSVPGGFIRTINSTAPTSIRHVMRQMFRFHLLLNLESE